MPTRRSFLSMLAGLVAGPWVAKKEKPTSGIYAVNGRAPMGAVLLRKNMTITFRDWDEAIDGPRA